MPSQEESRPLLLFPSKRGEILIVPSLPVHLCITNFHLHRRPFSRPGPSERQPLSLHLQSRLNPRCLCPRPGRWAQLHRRSLHPQEALQRCLQWSSLWHPSWTSPRPAMDEIRMCRGNVIAISHVKKDANFTLPTGMTASIKERHSMLRSFPSSPVAISAST